MLRLLADFDWRTWVYQRLISDAPTLALVPAAQIHGAGSITKPPTKKPFIVIKMEPEEPGPFPGVSRSRVGLWVHDEPGDYLQIGDIIDATKSALVGPGQRTGQVAAVGAVGARWMGTSGDLADPDFGTIFRTSTYDLLGKDGQP